MHSAFAHISPQHVDTIARSIVVTPNERLAREYTAAFDEAQIARGAQAWPSLPCKSLASFWLSQHAALRQRGTIATQILSPHDINLRFQQTAPHGFRHQCQAVIQAWLLTRRYSVALDHPLMQTSRSTYFSDWCRRAAPPPNSDFIVAEDLPLQLINHVDEIAQNLGQPIVLVDVEHLSPAERDFFSLLNQTRDGRVSLLQQNTWLPDFQDDLGLDASAMRDTVAESQLLPRGYGTFGEELMAAARWCAEVHQAHPDARIGVVVPDLSTHYDRVLRQFAATLSPNRDSRDPIFDLSGGKSLVGQPVWRHAKILLNWIKQPADQATLSPLLNSPYLSLPWCEDLRKEWPNWARRTVSPSAFARHEDAQPLLGLIQNLPSKARLDIWIASVAALLNSVRWPATSDLGSVQFQATVKIQEILAALAAEADDTLLNYDDALELMDWALDQTFAPQRQSANIQVLGMLETTGLSFSHLWVCGMSAEQFPGKSTLSAFIPRQVALSHGIPRCTQPQELAFAERTLASWINRTQTLQLSFTNTQNGALVRPTPLAAQEYTPAQTTALSEIAPTIFNLTQRHPFMQPTDIVLTLSQDAHGSAIPTGPVSGGSGRLENHAKCAFMGFALHRLGLKSPVPARDFLNAMERGSALHWVMEQYFQRYPDSSTALSQPTTVIEELCQQAIARYKHLPEPFVGAEQTRLTQLVTDWLAIEAERTPFRVAETEQRYALELGDLAFSLRIDRLDDVDGAMVLIDYKTGRVSTGPALGESPTAPQLPSYSLIRDDIAGVYYAQVRSTEQKLIGLAGEAEQLTETPKARVKTTPTASGWVQQQALWRQQLIGLATEIAAGDARVNPLPNACRHCDLKPLCRVDEKRRDPEQSA